ncbi:GNAT family N-acetyltransferase [Saccharospirillum sp.]|uniref:GNAT family N-acetyltransferase n=1 Tax=Saccharospirillum sp. TaxID=2033801 RepID=UPI0034A06720
MIRHATNTDFYELAELYHDASLIAHPFIDPDYIARDMRHLREHRLPLEQAFLWERHGDIAGYIALEGTRINGLFIKVDHQRQGIGRQLVEHVKQLHDELRVKVFQENYQAQRFYFAMGFEIVPETEAPTDGPNAQYCMRWPV